MNDLFDCMLHSLQNRSQSSAYLTRRGTMSYGALRNLTAGILSQIPPQTKQPVILFGHKELYMKAGMLACLFAGAPYVPIDRSTPPQRRAAILAHLRPVLCVGDLPECACAHLCAEDLERCARDGAALPLQVRDRNDDEIAYILFTSGSTGAPKGVQVRYANIISCVRWLRTLVPDAGSCILGHARFSFDLSVPELYLSSITGATHCVLEDDLLRDVPSLFSFLHASSAQTAVLTPSLARFLLADRSFNMSLMPHLRTMLFCGEALPSATAKMLFDRFPALRILNCYGPTECTFAVTAAEITRDEAAKPALPVGIAKPGVHIRITDDQMHPLPDGETGEIVICGDSVAAGYLPPASSDAFMHVDGVAAYRTGDRGFLQDKMLWFCGRKDRQIKLAGYRIELSDIESALMCTDGVRDAAVVCTRDIDGNARALHGFVVCDSTTTLPELFAMLKRRLPGYMMPRLHRVSVIPVTENGKRDEAALLHSGGLI